MQVFISAGEASGDMHAAAVIRALRERVDSAEVYGIAGPSMQQAGCKTLVDMHELNVMGISDVLRALPRIYRVRKRILAELESRRPDVAVLVDFPGFHINLGIRLRRLGIPVLHYIAPKLWAWGSWRVRKLKRSQDRLACILPFEPEWFAAHGIEAQYVGNPSAYVCSSGVQISRDAFKESLGLPKETPLLAMLPGSRPSELAHHVPLLLQAWREIHRHMPEARCVVPVAPGVSQAQLAPLIDAGAVPLDRMRENYALRADAAIAVSGTATLELALWDVPTVLVYRSSALTIYLARRLVQLRCAGLANIILGDIPVMPELIQEEATVDNIVERTLALLVDDRESKKQRDSFRELRNRLGNMNPAQGVVAMAIAMSGQSGHSN